MVARHRLKWFCNFEESDVRLACLLTGMLDIATRAYLCHGRGALVERFPPGRKKSPRK